MQQLAVLYGQEYHRPLGAAHAPAALPLLHPSDRHSHYRFAHKGTVRCMLLVGGCRLTSVGAACQRTRWVLCFWPLQRRCAERVA